MRLSRDKIQRMINAEGGSSSGGGGGSDIAGGVTQAWVNQNYVSIEFFRKVFKVWAAGETSSDPDVEIMPNDITTTVKNIQAQAGLWTEAFLSALGQGSGGGTGGATTLDQLDDVVITSPTNGQALIYNATTQMWVNGTIQSGTDMATVWSALAAATNEQINASHLSGVLADYVDSTSLQTILGDYLTQTAADQRYITIAYFDRLFRAYNGSTLVSHNDTTTTIDNIKAMFGFWTDMYLSALGRNSAATGLGIDNLTDVTITTPTDGQVLQYNATSSKWENATLNIQTVTTLAGLSDIVLTSLAQNQALIFDANTAKWINSSLKTINGNSIIGSGDIIVSGGGTGSYLPLAGGTMTGSILYQGGSGTFNIFGAGTNSVDIGWAYGTGSGAGMGLRGSNGNGGENGAFIYYAKLGNTVSHFQGFPNGELWWGTSQSDNKLRILSNGYCGINYPYPVCILHARGNATDGLPVILADGLRTSKWNFCLSALVSNINNNDIVVFTLGKAHNAYNCAVLTHCQVADGSSQNYFSIGYHSSNFLFNVRADGYVGVGTTSPSYKFTVSGDIYATGAITALSDMREKLVNEKAELPIEWIANAPAFSYYWKDKKAHDELLHVGSSAQYWKTVLPEVVLEAKDEKGTLSMQYGVAALVSAITIARKVVDHEQRITELEKENERLRTEIEQLRLN